nr:hypothetical protein [Amycolatopsis sp. MEP2-6]
MKCVVEKPVEWEFVRVVDAGGVACTVWNTRGQESAARRGAWWRLGRRSKIFQVMLTLPPMESVGYQRLLRTLVGTRAAQSAAVGREQATGAVTVPPRAFAACAAVSGRPVIPPPVTVPAWSVTRTQSGWAPSTTAQ